MIQEELWIERLANDAHIAYASSEKLWKAFAGQLELRLSDERAINLGSAGIWHLKLEPEYIAQVGEREGYVLVPPYLRLSIAIKLHDSRVAIPLIELSEGIALASGIRLERSTKWLEAIIPALNQLLGSGKPVYWRHIGSLHPIEGAKGSYRLDLSSAFASGLNKPFAAFVPTPLSGIEGHSDLEIRPLPSTPIWGEPYSVSFVPSNAETETGGNNPHSEISSPTTALAQIPETSLDMVESSEISTSNLEEAQAEETKPTTDDSTTSAQSAKDDIVIAAEVTSEVSAPEEALEEETPLDTPGVAKLSTTDQKESHSLSELSEQDIAPVSRGEEGVLPPERRSSYRAWPKRIAILLLLILLIRLGVSYLMGQRSREQTIPPKKEKITQTQLSVDNAPQHREVDSTTIQIAATKQREELTDTSSAPPSSAQADKMDTDLQNQPRQSVTSWASAPEEKITIQEGDKLADIAQRKYGHRAFWVYIYEENRELLPDPHHPTVGQKLTLPASKKYGIDPSNTKSVSRALVLQKSLSQ